MSNCPTVTWDPRTNQLQARVARGEAHRSALAMTEGRFDAGPPEATMELSNLGGMGLGTGGGGITPPPPKKNTIQALDAISSSELTRRCPEIL